MKKIIIKKNKGMGSLELLLDIMCNTFGGVMFIALLLVLMSLSIKDANKEVDDIDKNLSTNIHTLEAQIELFQTKKKMLLSQKKEMLNNIMKNEKMNLFFKQNEENELRKQRIQDKEIKINLLITQGVSKKLKIKQLITEKKEKQDKLLLNSKKIEELKAKELRLKKALANYQKIGSKKTVVLPVFKTSFKNPIFLHYLDNKIYLVSNPEGKNLHNGIFMFPKRFNHNDFDFDFTGDKRYTEYSPKKGAGILIKNEHDLKRILRDYQTKTPAEQFFINIKVDNESLENFCKYFNIFTEEGWNLNWEASNRKRNFRIHMSTEDYKSY
ncbi:hypothetical protein AAEX28_03555 [Lentisphaerota bacterium WC36G]|nr:hypothetical protein LJT99_06430 [Lentisphaerae bacterium WC36]